MSEPFIVNLAEARALSHPEAGTFVPFERPDDRFPEFGINVHVLEPGEPNVVHCPAGTAHVFVGAGDGPCAILMVGIRRADADTVYPLDETAARYGASAARTTSSSAEAYADWSSEFSETRLDWPLEG